MTLFFSAAYVYSRLYNLIDFPSGVVPITRVQDNDLVQMLYYPTDGEYHDVRTVIYLYTCLNIRDDIQILQSKPKVHLTVI